MIARWREGTRGAGCSRTRARRRWAHDEWDERLDESSTSAIEPAHAPNPPSSGSRLSVRLLAAARPFGLASGGASLARTLRGEKLLRGFGRALGQLGLSAHLHQEAARDLRPLLAPLHARLAVTRASGDPSRASRRRSRAGALHRCRRRRILDRAPVRQEPFLHADHVDVRRTPGPWRCAASSA